MCGRSAAVPAHRPPVQYSEHTAAAVISLDPAAVGACGIAARTTAGLSKPKLANLRYPEFVYAGWVFEPRMHDELALWLADRIGKDQRALLVVENATFRGTARHIGRAIGCIEGMLWDLNLAHPSDTQYVAPGVWRRGTLGKDLPAGRAALKAAAVGDVARRYQVTVSDDLAEAVLLNDYFIVHRKSTWMEGLGIRGKRDESSHAIFA